MRINCYCGNGIEVPYQVGRKLLHDFDKFCGINCLLTCLRFRKTKLNSSYLHQNSISEALDYYDYRFRMHFRSKSESIAAHFFQNNNINWTYEPYTISLNGSKNYTPDFFVEGNVFIEVKGLWSGSAKSKMRLARDLGYTIILVPQYLINIMDDWNKHNYVLLPSEESPYP